MTWQFSFKLLYQKFIANTHIDFDVNRFNYRSTAYMVKNGFYDFLNWFDDRAWYPLGRIVGGTVYPGLMITSGSIHYVLSYLVLIFYLNWVLFCSLLLISNIVNLEQKVGCQLWLNSNHHFPEHSDQHPRHLRVPSPTLQWLDRHRHLLPHQGVVVARGRSLCCWLHRYRARLHLEISGWVLRQWGYRHLRPYVHLLSLD